MGGVGGSRRRKRKEGQGKSEWEDPLIGGGSSEQVAAVRISPAQTWSMVAVTAAARRPQPTGLAAGGGQSHGAADGGGHDHSGAAATATDSRGAAAGTDAGR